MTGAFERGIFDITPWVDYDKKESGITIHILRLIIPVFLTRQIRKKELVPMVERIYCLDGLLLSLQKAGIGFRHTRPKHGYLAGCQGSQLGNESKQLLIIM